MNRSKANTGELMQAVLKDCFYMN